MGNTRDFKPPALVGSLVRAAAAQALGPRTPQQRGHRKSEGTLPSYSPHAHLVASVAIETFPGRQPPSRPAQSGRSHRTSLHRPLPGASGPALLPAAPPSCLGCSFPLRRGRGEETAPAQQASSPAPKPAQVQGPQTCTPTCRCSRPRISQGRVMACQTFPLRPTTARWNP